MTEIYEYKNNKITGEIDATIVFSNKGEKIKPTSSVRLKMHHIGVDYYDLPDGTYYTFSVWHGRLLKRRWYKSVEKINIKNNKLDDRELLYWIDSDNYYEMKDELPLFMMKILDMSTLTLVNNL